MERPAQRRRMADTEHTMASSVAQTIYKSQNMSGRKLDDDTSANILSQVAFDRKKKKKPQIAVAADSFYLIIIFI